jgi:uncharacterized membrane protein
MLAVMFVDIYILQTIDQTVHITKNKIVILESLRSLIEMSKEAARRRFVYNVLDYSWRRLVALYTFLGIVFVLILALFGFLVSQIVLPFLLGVGAVIYIILYWSRRQAEDKTRWTLRTAWQQVKHWNYGRKTKARTKEKREYEGYGYEFPKS